MECRASVIIVNWNSGALLEQCLAAVDAQTLQPLEVILVDNHSSDGSAEAAGEKFGWLRVIRAGANIGFAAANNLAVRNLAPESEWIVLLNPDAFPDPGWLEALVRAAGRNPEYAVFGSRLMNAQEPSTLDGAGDVCHISGLVWRQGHGTKMDVSCMKIREIFSPCAAAAMYRKDLFIAARGFDEDFFCYVEDVDLAFRLRLLGHRCLYVPDSVVAHVGSAVTGTRSDFSVYHGHRNLVWTFVKNMPGVLFWMLLPVHLALNVVTVFYFAMRGQGRLILRAKWDSARKLPSVWRKRRSIQLTRVASIEEIWRSLDKRVIPARQGRFGKH